MMLLAAAWGSVALEAMENAERLRTAVSNDEFQLEMAVCKIIRAGLR